MRAEVVAAIEHVVADRAGYWRVSIVGSQANDRWEMNIADPKGFERSYTLEGTPKEQLQQQQIKCFCCNMLLADGKGTEVHKGGERPKRIG